MNRHLITTILKRKLNEENTFQSTSRLSIYYIHLYEKYWKYFHATIYLEFAEQFDIENIIVSIFSKSIIGLFLQ